MDKRICSLNDTAADLPESGKLFDNDASFWYLSQI